MIVFIGSRNLRWKKLSIKWLQIPDSKMILNAAITTAVKMHSQMDAWKVFRVWKTADVTFLLDSIKYFDWTLWKKYSEEL